MRFRNCLFGIVLVLFIILYGCGSKSESYYPTGEGKSWVYQKSTVSGFIGVDAGDKKVIVTNMPSRDLSNNKVIPKKYEQDGKVNFIYISEKKNGVSVFARQGTNSIEPTIFKDPIYVLKYPIQKGTSWEATVFLNLMGWKNPLILKYEIDNIDDTVTVPAGSFNKCIKVKGFGQIKTDIGGFITREEHDWYAPNVGWIKGVYKEEFKKIGQSAFRTFQLESFKK